MRLRWAVAVESCEVSTPSGCSRSTDMSTEHPGPVSSAARPKIWSAAIDLVASRHCAGCGRPDVLWCPECAVSLSAAPHRSAPSPTPPGFPACWSVARYDGPVREALSAYKDRGQRPLLAPLSRALARAVGAALRTITTNGLRPVVVPAPSSPTAVRRRGGDSMAALAEGARRELARFGVEILGESALVLTREVADQSGLGASGRWGNLADSMSVGERGLVSLTGHDGRRCRPVVVVDDVVTTGSTLSEAVRALAAVGVTEVRAATIASTSRR